MIEFQSRHTPFVIAFLGTLAIILIGFTALAGASDWNHPSYVLMDIAFISMMLLIIAVFGWALIDALDGGA